jgi:hypothetical protein
MFNPHSMPISPLGKREFPEEVDCDISLQTSQLGIYSPPPGHHIDTSYKRPRFDHSLLNNNRVLDNLCNLSYSALANIDLEVTYNSTPHFSPLFFFYQYQKKKRQTLF